MESVTVCAAIVCLARAFAETNCLKRNAFSVLVVSVSAGVLFAVAVFASVKAKRPTPVQVVVSSQVPRYAGERSAAPVLGKYIFTAAIAIS